MSLLTRAGSTRGWRRLRLEILDRDGGICCWCDATDATHVDHLIPRSRGGDDDPTNLVTSCARCNLSRGAGPGRRTDPPSRSW